MTEKEFEKYRQKIRKERVKIADINYKEGGLRMLRIIANEQGWEESEEYYKDKFLKNEKRN